MKLEVACYEMFLMFSFHSRKIFNVVDDDPAPRAEVFAFARSLIEMRYPDLIAKAPDVNSAESGIQERIVPAEKRVSNARLKKELGVKLLHPTYRSGLQSILDSWPTEFQLPGRSR
jgi:nucleoside-diphosphate-sugar epimerase